MALADELPFAGLHAAQMLEDFSGGKACAHIRTEGEFRTRQIRHRKRVAEEQAPAVGKEHEPQRGAPEARPMKISTGSGSTAPPWSCTETCPPLERFPVGLNR
jgi:hypothetical protein